MHEYFSPGICVQPALFGEKIRRMSACDTALAARTKGQVAVRCQAGSTSVTLSTRDASNALPGRGMRRKLLGDKIELPASETSSASESTSSFCMMCCRCHFMVRSAVPAAC